MVFGVTLSCGRISPGKKVPGVVSSWKNSMGPYIDDYIHQPIRIEVTRGNETPEERTRSKICPAAKLPPP